MKKLSKFLALALTLVMIAAAFAGCGEKKVQTGSTFTYWVTMDTSTAQTLTSFSELMMYKEMEKRTGTKVDFIHPASGSTGTEAFQILLSSGDYPDMIEYNWSSYAGGADQAIDDGVIIALNDYMEDYAPNYYDIMEGERAKENNYLYKAATITSNGNYYGFKGINVGKYRGFGGLIVRRDLLDNWGLDIPVTIDDWDKLFETAKENGIKYPLTGDSSLFTIRWGELFNTAWKVGKGFYADGTKVKFGPFEKAYKDYVVKMAEWREKGYIDIDYITNNSTNIEGYLANGTSIAAYGYVGGTIGKLLPAMADRDPNYDLAACPFPVMKEGDKAWFQELQAEATEPCIAISTQCGIDNEERYKEAIKWCDYLYSDEGIILKSFGIEGDTFTVEKDENGEDRYVYTEKITDHEKLGAHSISASLYHFFLPANHPGYNQHPDYLKGFYPYSQQVEAIEVWNKDVEEAKKHVLPSLSYTSEEAAEKANIESKGRSKLDAVISNIILGKADIDTYDDAVKQAKKDGYDKLLKITQAAYDRYMSSAK